MSSPTDGQPANAAERANNLRAFLEGKSREQLVEYINALHYLIDHHVTRQREDGEQLAGTNRKLEARNKQLRQLISRDLKTGLLNDRGLAEALGREIARLAREGGNLLAVSLDLRNLKEVNDYLGHPWGDDLISMTVDRIHTRPYDITARIGGDEFVVIMINAEHEALERLRDDLTVPTYGPVAHLGHYSSSWGDNGTPDLWSEERITDQYLAILRGADQDMIVGKNQAEAEEIRDLDRYLQGYAEPGQDCRRQWWLTRLEPLREELERWREGEKQPFLARLGLLEE